MKSICCSSENNIAADAISRRHFQLCFSAGNDSDNAFMTSSKRDMPLVTAHNLSFSNSRKVLLLCRLEWLRSCLNTGSMLIVGDRWFEAIKLLSGPMYLYVCLQYKVCNNAHIYKTIRVLPLWSVTIESFLHPFKDFFLPSIHMIHIYH